MLFPLSLRVKGSEPPFSVILQGGQAYGGSPDEVTQVQESMFVKL